MNTHQSTKRTHVQALERAEKLEQLEQLELALAEHLNDVQQVELALAEHLQEQPRVTREAEHRETRVTQAMEAQARVTQAMEAQAQAMEARVTQAEQVQAQAERAQAERAQAEQVQAQAEQVQAQAERAQAQARVTQAEQVQAQAERAQARVTVQAQAMEAQARVTVRAQAERALAEHMECCICLEQTIPAFKCTVCVAGATCSTCAQKLSNTRIGSACPVCKTGNNREKTWYTSYDIESGIQLPPTQAPALAPALAQAPVPVQTSAFENSMPYNIGMLGTVICIGLIIHLIAGSVWQSGGGPIVYLTIVLYGLVFLLFLIFIIVLSVLCFRECLQVIYPAER